MSTITLSRRLTIIERAVNPARRDTVQARICVIRAGESHEEALGRHRLEYGRAPVVMVSEKRVEP